MIANVSGCKLEFLNLIPTIHNQNSSENIWMKGFSSSSHIKKQKQPPIISQDAIYEFATSGNSIGANEVFSSFPNPDQQMWNTIIDANVKHGQGEIALELYAKMQQNGGNPDKFTHFSTLETCNSIGAIEQGRRLHAEIVENGFQSDISVQTTLLHLYVKCGNLSEACTIFYSLPNKNVVLWTLMIVAYVQLDKDHLALECFHNMEQEGIKPSKVTFFSMIKACGRMGSIEQGKIIHEQIIENAFQSDTCIGNALVNMYAKCGLLKDAFRVFCRLPAKNVVSWNSIILGCSQQGRGFLALEYFEYMQHDMIKPDNVTFLGVTKACGILSAISVGRQIHCQILDGGFFSDNVLGSGLVDMYVKCGSLVEARLTFEGLPKQNVVAWSIILAGYAQHNKGYLALECFETMKLKGVEPNRVTFLSLLKACTSIGIIQYGRCIHDLIFKNRLQSDVVIGNTLVDMYAKCGSLEEAHRTFDQLVNRTVVSWDIIIAGYSQQGKSDVALKYLEHMEHDGFKPSRVTYLTIFKACGVTGAIEWGRRFHEQIFKNDLQADIAVSNALVDMYAKTGSLEEAQNIFCKLLIKDVISWGAMIAGYAEHDGPLALECFGNMQHSSIVPSSVIFLSVLKACGSVGVIEHGRRIHELIIEHGFESCNFVGNSLVDMYAKCGKLEEAHRIHKKLPNQDIVSWNAMISGFVEHGEGCFALDCFENMQQIGIRGDKMTYSGILRACTSIGTIAKGRCIHELIIQERLETEIYLGNGLLDMYSKCGNLEMAFMVFVRMPSKNLVSWNTMIAAYAQFGEAESTVQCLQDMRHHYVKADNVTFVGILASLSQTGLVDEGLWYFRNMEECYGLETNVLHFTCIVDLLGHAGCFNEAMGYLEAVTHRDISLHMSLLSACELHCNVDLGNQCFYAAVSLDPYCSAAYILISKIWANAQMNVKC